MAPVRSSWRPSAASLLCRGRHALAVDRVEAADGVAEEHPSEREPPHSLDVAALVGGEPVRHRVGERLGDLHHLGDHR